MNHEGKCKMCKKPLSLEIADDYPGDVNALLSMAVCNHCGDLRLRREQVTERIKLNCERLAQVQNEMTREDREAVHSRLSELTEEFAKVIAEFYHEPQYLWNADFPALLMQKPLRWPAILDGYREQFRAWRKQKRQPEQATA